MRTVLVRLSGFSALSLVSSLLPLAVLPAVARVSTPPEWTTLLVAQAVGAYAGAATFVGWNVLGSARVATTSSEDARLDLYARSFAIRFYAASVFIPSACAAAAVLTASPQVLIATTAAAAGGVSGLSLSWYAIGSSQPRLLAFYEVVPKAIFSGLSIPIVIATGDIIWYPIAILLGVLSGLILAHIQLFSRLLPPWPSWRTIRDDARDLKKAWGVEVLGNIHASAPTPIASGVTSAGLAAAFASGDRLYRYVLVSVSALSNSLQGWALDAKYSSRAPTRAAAALVAHGALGLCGALGIAIFGPWATEILFGEALAADQITMFWLGLAFGAVSVSTPLIRIILMPARQDRWVLFAVAGGAFVGVSMMIMLGTVFGSNGVAAGAASSELFVLTVCATAALLARIRRKATTRATYTNN